MSHFYGVVNGQSRTDGTRRGSQRSGLATTAASWDGAIKVDLSYDEKAGRNRYTVRMTQWGGSSNHEQLIDTGIVGQPSEAARAARLLDKLLHNKVALTLVGLDPELDTLIEERMKHGPALV